MIICKSKTENDGLYYSTHSSTQVQDKVWILREMLSKKEIWNTEWISTIEQTDDELMKTDVDSYKVRRHVGHLKMPLT